MSKSKDNRKKSFVMYASFLEAMKHLNDVEYRECMTMISEYALNGVEEKSSSPSVNIILEMAKPNLEAASRRYDACVENGKKGAEYGKLGGAPKGNQNARKKQPLKQPLDVDLNENEEVNVDDYINEYVNNDAAYTPEFYGDLVSRVEKWITYSDTHVWLKIYLKEPSKENLDTLYEQCKQNDAIIATDKNHIIYLEW